MCTTSQPLKMDWRLNKKKKKTGPLYRVFFKINTIPSEYVRRRRTQVLRNSD